MTDKLGIIVLAAGEGTRMKSARPKVLHPVAGEPMLGHVLKTAAALKPAKMVVVTGHGRDAVDGYIARTAKGTETVLQAEQKGTGHAVMMAEPHFRDFKGRVLILFGDTPLIRPGTLKNFIGEAAGAPLLLLGMMCQDAKKYGRLVLDEDGFLKRIVEFADASIAEKRIRFCNTGVMLADAGLLFGYLKRLGTENAKGEYYLTDVIEIAREDGHKIPVAHGDEMEFQGVNTKGDLALVEKEKQNRLREAAMEAGVTLIAPETVFLAEDTKLSRDVTIHAYVVFGPGVVVEEGVTIHSFSHLEDCVVRKGASIGPFARLRPGADIGEGAKIGNFVEVKKSKLGKGAKASHLAYIGDATVAANVNIGAGVITCNYDGYDKFPTEVGEGAFIGSNVSLVAPVKIGKGAIIGAGSVITKDVAGEDLAVARAKQENLKGAAKSFRAKKGK